MLGVDINTWVLLSVALMNAFTLYYARRTELNTNSMKDALVLRTAESFEAKGREGMRAEAEQKAANVAQGVVQGEAKSGQP